MKAPQSWQIKRLGDLLEKIGSGVTPKGGKESYLSAGVPLIRSQNVLWGKLSLEDVAYIDATQHRKMSGSYVRPNDVLLNITGASIGRACIAPANLGEANVSQHVCILRPKAVLHAKFLLMHLASGYGQRQIDLFQAGGNRQGLNYDQIRTFEVPLPPLPEQQKIADVLGTWDEALEKLDALIAAKARRKQALMQQLLTGHRRLPGFKKKWQRVELSEVAEECSIRNGQKLDRTRLYAVTKAEGMVPMRENVQGATINRCQIVERGWFAYNPMRINIGSIARWEHADPVMVSPDYVVFRTKESLLLSDYLNHVRRAALWSDFVGAAGNGSVRIRIWFDDLGYFEFPLPPIEEQRAIAAVLDTADAELRLRRQQRTALDQQKRGLMQQLLTGKVRVSV
jgi:type I restriction enzyme S subunit